MPPLNLNDAEAIRDLIVTPVVEGLEDRIVVRLASLESASAAHAADIAGLKSNQQKALWGYAGIVAVGTVGFNAAMAWVKKKLHLGD